MGAVACEENNHWELWPARRTGGSRESKQSSLSLFPPSILMLVPPTSQTQPEARGQGSPGVTVHRAGQRTEISL